MEQSWNCHEVQLWVQVRRSGAWAPTCSCSERWWASPAVQPPGEEHAATIASGAHVEQFASLTVSMDAVCTPQGQGRTLQATANSAKGAEPVDGCTASLLHGQLECCKKKWSFSPRLDLSMTAVSQSLTRKTTYLSTVCLTVCLKIWIQLSGPRMRQKRPILPDTWSSTAKPLHGLSVLSDLGVDNMMSILPLALTEVGALTSSMFWFASRPVILYFLLQIATSILRQGPASASKLAVRPATEGLLSKSLTVLPEMSVCHWTRPIFHPMIAWQLLKLLSY